MAAMMLAVGSHLWESTLFAVAVALVALALRRNPADVRFRLWVAASVKFLVPFAALEAIGRELAPAVAAPRARFDVAMIIETVSHPLSARMVVPAAGPSSLARVADVAPAVAGVIWIVGAAALLAGWWIRWRRVQRAVRTAAPLDRGREVDALRRVEAVSGVSRSMPLVSTDASAEPGVFGILRPVLLWPPRISEQLSDAQIETVLAHEVSHVRRRDNLVALLHMAVQAAFWFHPLVWWIGARLDDERERACDEAVLDLGSDPEAYAESILTACRLSVDAPVPCVSGVTGSNLTRRIERIMTNARGERLTPARRLVLAAASIATVALPLAVGAAQAPRLLARTQANGSQAAAVQFEVASVKRNPGANPKVSIGMMPGGRFDAANVTLRQLIRNAYQLQDSQILGGPGWLDADRFDVVAKAEGDAGDFFEAEKRGTPSRWQLMLRSLLSERFKLVVHTESKELSIYALMAARSDGVLGPSLHRSGDCKAPGADGRAQARPTDPPACGMRIFPGTILAGSVSMGQFANLLSNLVGRLVVDRTGFADNFEFTLRFTPDQMPAGFGKKAEAIGLAPADPDGASLFTAIREQLGLKLDAQKGAVDVLVIDSAAHPVEN
jgi:bla regulator protein blaR1